MATPKYTDLVVQNQTEDEITDPVDSLNTESIKTAKTYPSKRKNRKKITGKEKIKSYKEGNRDDTTLDEYEEAIEDEDIDYGFDADEEEQDDSQFYGKGL